MRISPFAYLAPIVAFCVFVCGCSEPSKEVLPTTTSSLSRDGAGGGGPGGGGPGGGGGMGGKMGGMMGGMGGKMGGMGGGMMGGKMGGMGGGPGGPGAGGPGAGGPGRGGPGAPAAPKADPVPVPVEAGIAKLAPETSSIGFIGTHAEGPPNPRTCGFEKFAGQIQFAEDNATIKSIVVDIDTESVWTEMQPLTTHLTSPDFFNAREFPQAKFVSTKIEPGADIGSYQVTGNLTLLAATKEISFPASVINDGKGLLLKAEFTIDRNEFGMDKLADRVAKEVTIKVAVGEKTQPTATSGGFGPGPASPAGPPSGPGAQ